MDAAHEAGRWIRAFEELGRGDVALVGGKNASLGEMIRALSGQGIRVPAGFATTAEAYRRFVAENHLEGVIVAQVDALHADPPRLAEVGEAIREAFLAATLPEEIATAIREAYRALAARRGGRDPDVAVRSSATAEDLPEASFAGQQESFLGVRGEGALLEACRRCYASLFTNRAISYREEQGFDHRQVALSVGVQEMVRSDLAGAGVMFSLDPETGFRDVVVIDANHGLGESVVQGTVDPDEYVVFKPLLDAPRCAPILDKKRGVKEEKVVYAERGGAPTRSVPTSEEERMRFVLEDAEILALARMATRIEAHYGTPMDIEWAKDGKTGELHVVQARPETVQSRRDATSFRRYTLREKGQQLVRGLAIGEAVVTGRVCVVKEAAQIDRFEEGAVLVARMTDPDWVPIMKRASAIVTDHGGRTSHAAIVSRELGVLAVVGAGDATRVLRDGQQVTVSCAEGQDGFVYEGAARFDVEEIGLGEVPATRTKVMINLASPAAAFRWARLPADGVGLARIEFIISGAIKVHPMALVRYDALEDEAAKREIAALTRGFDDKSAYFVDELAHGIARLAAAQYPRPVIVRTSDFKTNEYARLVGGRDFEPAEANPMIGFRGASRYYSERYREGFALECRALRKVREEMGLANVVVMIPFCRTPTEADRVLEVMAENGLVRGENGLEVYAMCEIPANVFLAEEFAKRFDGFSIGSNDLTQLILGVDRDSAELAAIFDERNPAVTKAICDFIRRVHATGGVVGFCGQAPTNDPSFARLLVEAGIDSISVSPDSFLAAKREVAGAEAALGEAQPRGSQSRPS
jgi:pyruvate, water dikinase